MQESFGQDLRQARKDADVELVKMARLSDFSESYLRRVENGTRAATARVVGFYDKVLNADGQLLAAFLTLRGMNFRPWDAESALAVLDGQEDWGSVDRRAFVTATAFPVLATRWRTSINARRQLGRSSSRNIPLEPLLAGIESRLEGLWRLDDELGSRGVGAMAYNELNLAAALIKRASYGDATASRMHSLAAEAARQVAWSQFDQGKPESAAIFFETALRCSAEANDPQVGAYAMSFAAVQAYSTPKKAGEAVDLLECAAAVIRRTSTSRMQAMLAARHARALSKIGDRHGCARMLDIARDRLDAGTCDDDPPALYWVTEREIDMIAGSSALDLGDPVEALRCFTAALNAGEHDEEFPRSDAIYLARAAEAHLGLSDVDGAVAKAKQATRCLGGVESARSSSTLTTLRTRLEDFGQTAVVRDFLEETG